MAAKALAALHSGAFTGMGRAAQAALADSGLHDGGPKRHQPFIRYAASEYQVLPLARL